MSNPSTTSSSAIRRLHKELIELQWSDAWKVLLPSERTALKGMETVLGRIAARLDRKDSSEQARIEESLQWLKKIRESLK